MYIPLHFGQHENELWRLKKPEPTRHKIYRTKLAKIKTKSGKRLVLKKILIWEIT